MARAASATDQRPDELAQLRDEFASYRRRARRERDEARARGRDEVASELVELLDDLERALTTLEQSGAGAETIEGLRRLQSAACRRFLGLGYELYGEEGDSFDAEIHDAIAVEPGFGVDGTILRVHRQGLARGELVIRPALVSVLKGSELPELAGDEEEEVVPRRRRPRGSSYSCPFGTPGCVGNCSLCDPPGDESREEDQQS